VLLTLQDRCRNISNRVSVFQDKHDTEMDHIADELWNILQSIERAESRNLRHHTPDAEQITKELALARNIFQAAGPSGDLRRYLGTKAKRGAGSALSILLGKKTNVATFSNDKLLQVKEEYQQFRSRAAWRLLLYPLAIYVVWVHSITTALNMNDPKASTAGGIRTSTSYSASTSTLNPSNPSSPTIFTSWSNIFTSLSPVHVATIWLGRAEHGAGLALAQISILPFVMTAVQILLAWMLLVYTGLAMRENVLRVNGSNIRKWWIYHHYISILLLLVLLSLPVDAFPVQNFMGPLLLLIVFQAVVMLFQTWNNRRRLYTRVAIGKAGLMDVAAGDSSIGAAGNIWLLYVVVFCFQFYEGYLGVSIIREYIHAFWDTRGYVANVAQVGSTGSSTSATTAFAFGGRGGHGDNTAGVASGFPPLATTVDLRAMRGLVVAGVFLVVLALGNFQGTVRALVAKMWSVSKGKRGTRERSAATLVSVTRNESRR
jgi:hypothetical protein